MLQLQKIRKVYVTGSESVEALKGITLSFRKQEFVSVLGPSGCGKTTLLNIIGGLDQYTSGDLSIDGRSTKEYKDRDWDTYRNHSIGFVFQSYNLIPHQSVLANVELALTISGVSRRERRRRAANALRRVGLGNQLHKKPNQMSGGQMQRVAIARAIVNDPEILLADEPTGALDSTTSVQIMDLLSEIARDRLVIMVTHNPDLARTYSNRIIYMTDGLVTKDTRPFDPAQEEAARRLPAGQSTGRPAVDTYMASYRGTRPATLHETAPVPKRKKKKASMSFLTALSLSLKNLLTKKTRTMLTAFAGSIGIIGIALIQSVSSGVQYYIDRVQEDTLSSYPITIQRENADMSALLESLMNIGSESGDHRDEDRVYANSVLFEMMNSLTKIEIEENNLSKFKEFLESDEEVRKYISAVHYSYGSGLQFYTKDDNGEIYKADINEMMNSFMGATSGGSSGMGGSMGTMGMMGGGLTVFDEILPGDNGTPIHDLVKEQYDMIYGSWPTAYNEVVLIVDGNNSISDLSLYALGLKSVDEFETAMKNFYLGKETATDEKSWSFEEICSRTYRMVLNVDRYQKGEGDFTDLSKTLIGREILYNSGTEIRVTGIIRKNPDALSAMLSGSIAYTSLLTDYMIEKTLESELLQAQLQNPEIDALTGLPFETEDMGEPTAAEIRAAVTAYINDASEARRAAVYRTWKGQLPPAALSMIETQVNAAFVDKETALAFLSASGSIPPASLAQLAAQDFEVILQLKPTVQSGMVEAAEKKLAEELALVPDATAATLLQDAVASFSDADCKLLYDEYASAVSENTYTGVLDLLGYVDADFPSSILIYAQTFEDKDRIAECIKRYNSGVAEADVIEYTDYVALLMSSISTVISAISYVLIAFVAISLVVSSIMISIITYISVLERTKEIGVLRAIGASKRDVSRVFNAETLIEGFVSGMLGIGVTLLLLIPINLILHAVTGIQTLSAVLPVGYAVGLVVISMLLTVVAGIIPSGMAAKRDPVAALRSE